jgi:hypothetical protein
MLTEHSTNLTTLIQPAIPVTKFGFIEKYKSLTLRENFLTSLVQESTGAAQNIV